jgi:4-diphosphocytidyl-2-C-methyl-D-erythritol kinase
MSRAAVELSAPAKLNLVLDVLGVRDDGYHELSTCMLALGLADRLRVRRNDGGAIALAVSGPQASPDVPTDAANLASRAAAAVLERARRAGVAGAQHGLDLELEKEVPSQSGLGGASADAAAAWIGAHAALGLALDEPATAQGLAELGSDCAFFYAARDSGVAWCTGRGELVRPLARAPTHWQVAILTPHVRCPTAAVYSALRNCLSTPAEVHSLPATWCELSASAARRYLFNRLEAAALEAFPQLRAWRELLDGCAAEHFRLSGSGASFFGLFDHRVEAQQALERISSRARSQGLELRGRWLTQPSGHGAVTRSSKL